jgi:hypothetical protein
VKEEADDGEDHDEAGLRAAGDGRVAALAWRPLFTEPAAALHGGEAKRIAETMVRGIDRTTHELVS